MTELEKLARLLCSNEGWEPDTRIFTTDLPIGPQNRPWVPNSIEPVPAWTLYAEYVKAVLSTVLGDWADYEAEAIYKTAEAQQIDLQGFIEGILRGGQEAPPEEEEPIEQPSTDWRDRYHLRQRPGVGLIPK
jgi:hypothetical protein